MDEVCAELDGVLVELMDCLEQLAVLRKRFSDCVSEGYFNMAKARYSMGPNTVTPLNYDTLMRASALVGVAEGAESATHNEFTVYRRNSSNPGRDERVGRENQLRRRTPHTGEPEPHGEEGGVEEVPGREEEGVKEKTEEEKNPLKWFGVLVPNSLRQSQGHFIQATAMCGELATQQSRLETLRLQYHSLSRRKENLITNN